RGPCAEIPPPRARRRRLRGCLSQGEGARSSGAGRLRRLRARAPRRRRADVHQRPRRKPRRGRLAGRLDARPVDRYSHDEAFGRDRAIARSRAVVALYGWNGRGAHYWRRMSTVTGAPKVRKPIWLAPLLRYVPWILSGAAVAFALLWIAFLAEPCSATGCVGTQTNFGSAVDDPRSFLATLLDGITAAGVYFVVASGFTLIFGLMRVVNMAHGAFFLLGGYVALKLERKLVGQDSAFGILSSQVSFWQWVVPAVIA